MRKLMADTDRCMELEVNAITSIVLCDQVLDEHLVAQARQTTLFAVDMLTKLRQNILAHFGNLPHNASVLGRGDPHLIALRQGQKIGASAEISAGCHGLDADRRFECRFLGKLESAHRMVLGMTFRCVLAMRKEMDFIGTFYHSKSDRTSTPSSPWTTVHCG